MRRAMGIFLLICSAGVRASVLTMPERLRLSSESTRSVATAAQAKSITVDCTKGQRIQDAVDKNSGPMEIFIHGICVEDLRIDRKVVTLRGSSQFMDGVQGTSDTTAAVTFMHVDGARLENLSISDGPGFGVSFSYTHAYMAHCRVAGNARTGILVTENSHVTAEAVVSNNNRNGALVEHSALFWCVGCIMSDNDFSALRARFGGVASLGNSLVTGSNGIWSEYYGYAEMYCESDSCNLNVSALAARGSQHGRAALFDVPVFTGEVRADENGDVKIWRSSQISAIGINRVESFGTLLVDGGRLSAPLSVNAFGRAVMSGSSNVGGTINCSSAGDVWLESSVVVSPGVHVTGCAHASAP